MSEDESTSADAVVAELKPLGSERYKKVLLRHGICEPCFGVKIGDLKKIQRRIKKDHQLALALYDTGIYDAMYLAGLIADDVRMTREDLGRWAEKACGPLAGSTVPWVAAGNVDGLDVALEWIESGKDFVAAAGWNTLSCLVSIKCDSELQLAELKGLLQRVRREIHKAPDTSRYAMNGFVIAVGCYVQKLTGFAKRTANEIGRVSVDMGDTACRVPFAPDFIRKVEERGTVGKKRKSVKC